MSTLNGGNRPLKILCLHGYCQNAQLFRRKSGSVRKSLERSVMAVRRSLPATTPTTSASISTPKDESFPLAEFQYMEAPFVLEEKLIEPDNDAESTPTRHPGKGESDKYISTYRPVKVSCTSTTSSTTTSTSATSSVVSIDRTKRSWWQAENSEDKGMIYHGWELAIQDLRTEFKENKYDGVLGFSQGAVIASIICALRENDISTPENQVFDSLRFGLFFSGAKSRALLHFKLFEKRMNVPSLHVWGSKDEIVPSKLSEVLYDQFNDSNKIQHVFEGGHFIPSDKTSRNVISQFVLDVYDNKVNNNDCSWLRACL